MSELIRYWPACCCGGIVLFGLALAFALSLAKAAAGCDAHLYCIRDK